MLKDRINEIFTVIGATSADIARCAGCDHSNISRIASGARIPKPAGVGAARLIRGICAFAEQAGRIPELCMLAGCAPDTATPELSIRLMAWLYGDYAAPAKPRAAHSHVPFRAFGEKLSAAMDVCGLSNVRLGRMINVDTSYVSRFKNGLRSPRSNPQTMESISSAIAQRAIDMDKCGELCALMKCPVSRDFRELNDSLYNWLYSGDVERTGPAVEKLLEGIDTFMPGAGSFPALDAQALASSGESVYIGSEGLQSAVLRLLASALNAGRGELFLYSDQRMDWLMVPGFHEKWISLMFSCVQKGICIHIIHNIDRDACEMIDAIRLWLPLYMSGQIDSYYLRSERSTRFSTTFFLCPGVGCIKGVNAAGAEAESGDYRYDTDPALLEKHLATYRALMSEARSLVRIGDGIRSGELAGSGASYFCTAPSIATLPRETLTAVLDRCGADEQTRLAAMNARDDARAIFDGITESMQLTEFVPAADDEALYSGKIPILPQILSAAYTPEEYACHVRSVIGLMKSRPNYRFCLLPDAPFPNTHIFISGSHVAVTRLVPPCVTFQIDHPALCEVFSSYASGIAARYLRDRGETEKALERSL